MYRWTHFSIGTSTEQLSRLKQLGVSKPQEMLDGDELGFDIG